ncbi:MAG: hypothetical protein COT89_00680 [Candidatus Colwellbacteria bacterium CG10_big_fil_rev_8_21_14_0_10_42_22]|uniref:DUF192 domain-containing protein n=1 Tax=Candidatus Colwellbacteria bacterium CG10_big_fil_rev_8_21_14_0_10_42_22 TaxID=1974540 RepID=A0A2H0VGH5_9BACT|nr:MAG: hypothetical protein COT89_00680 [Candidatus Colwellbacteria bacterium CG10_big_fil_rev_8_21_14_0_10_42_22]
MKSIYILGLVATAFLIFWFLRGDWLPKAQYKKATIVVSGQEFRVDVANTAIQQAKGLGGEDALAQNEGMLFVFDSPTNRKFWMKDMLIPIDIIWIKDNQVVGVEHRVDPEINVPLYKKKRYPSPQRVNYVLEIASGRASALGIKKGTDVSIRFE